MNRRLITINESASVFEAINCFHLKKVSCLPVVNESGSPVGIISWRDIIDTLAKQMLKKRQA